MMRFKVGKTDVTISFWFVAVLTLMLLIDRGGYAIVSIIAVLTHEMAHILAFFILGIYPKLVSFELTGIRITKPQTLLSNRDELFIQSAGIICNFICFILMLPWVIRGGFVIDSFSVLCYMNLAVGGFNLLPISVFDGGKVVRILLCRIFSRDINKANRIANVISTVTLVLLVIVAVYLLCNNLI